MQVDRNNGEKYDPSSVEHLLKKSASAEVSDNVIAREVTTELVQADKTTEKPTKVSFAVPEKTKEVSAERSVKSQSENEGPVVAVSERKHENSGHKIIISIGVVLLAVTISLVALFLWYRR